jgi:hypothetical protein
VREKGGVVSYLTTRKKLMCEIGAGTTGARKIEKVKEK